MVWSGNVLSLTEVLNIENIFQFAISGTCEYTRLLRSEPIFCVLRAVRKKGAGISVEKRTKTASNRQVSGERRTEYPRQERRDFDRREVKAILEAMAGHRKQETWTDKIGRKDEAFCDFGCF
jgi:hypothetical protein